VLCEEPRRPVIAAKVPAVKEAAASVYVRVCSPPILYSHNQGADLSHAPLPEGCRGCLDDHNAHAGLN